MSAKAVLDSPNVSLISVDPSNLEAPEVSAPLTLGMDTTGAPVLHPALIASRSALKTMHSAALDLESAEKAIRQTPDPTANKRLRAGAEKRLSEATKAAAGALDSLTEHRAQVEGQIESALGIPEARTSVTAAMRASDIRATIRAIGNPTARTEALRTAILSGDREAASAALSCSPLALGITQRDVEGLRQHAEGKFTPELVRLRSGLDRVRGIVEQAQRTTSTRFGSLIGKGDSNAAKAEAALRALEANGGAA